MENSVYLFGFQPIKESHLLSVPSTVQNNRYSFEWLFKLQFGEALIMVEPRLPLHLRVDLTKFLNRIQNADITEEDKHRLLLLWSTLRDDIREVENKHNG